MIDDQKKTNDELLQMIKQLQQQVEELKKK